MQKDNKVHFSLNIVISLFYRVCCLGVMGNCLCRFEPFNHKVSANAKSGLRFYLLLLSWFGFWLSWNSLLLLWIFFSIFSPEITRFSYGSIPKKLSQTMKNLSVIYQTYLIEYSFLLSLFILIMLSVYSSSFPGILGFIKSMFLFN